SRGAGKRAPAGAARGAAGSAAHAGSVATARARAGSAISAAASGVAPDVIEVRVVAAGRCQQNQAKNFGYSVHEVLGG
ncbi:MAG TPA: hypothetical protein VIM73_03370, partial [Polyangiaceae bacterium]